MAQGSAQDGARHVPGLAAGLGKLPGAAISRSQICGHGPLAIVKLSFLPIRGRRLCGSQLIPYSPRLVRQDRVGGPMSKAQTQPEDKTSRQVLVPGLNSQRMLAWG